MTDKEYSACIEDATTARDQPFVPDPVLEKKFVLPCGKVDNRSQLNRLLWKIDMRLIPPLFVMV